MKIAVVGVGAIGGVLAAELLKAGREVTLCVRRRFDALRVTGPGENFRARVAPLDNPALIREPVDLVLLATKAHQTASAAGWLRKLCVAGTVVAVAQNGVEHRERAAPYCGAATVLPLVVRLPAECVAPGVIVRAGGAALIAPASAAGETLRQAFENTGVKVTLSEDFVTDMWQKLCQNVANGSVTALTIRPNNIVREHGIAILARRLIEETVAVGRAEGAKLDPELAETIVAAMAALPDSHGNSMYYDRRAGRPLEVDARSGAVVRFGKKHGIPTPLNSAVLALLSVIGAQRSSGDSMTRP